MIFFGTTGNDVLIGTVNADTAFGIGGDDIIAMGAGNDTVFGGAGLDTAVFTDSVTQSGLALTNTGGHNWTSTSTDGVDTYQDVEFFQFPDLFFDARVDLSVSAPTVNQTHLLAGQYFHVGGWVVTNSGYEDSINTSTQFLVDGVAVNTLSAPSIHRLQLGDNTQVGTTFDWVLSADPNTTHTLAMVADASGSNAERNESNNVSGSVAVTILNNGSLDSHGFDAFFYLAANPDVAAAGYTLATAWNHYNTYGWHEGRDPNALFSTNYYLATNPDVAAAGINPLTHYMGNANTDVGRNPSAFFDTSSYLSAYLDVAAAGVNPLLHFYNNGVPEHRDDWMVT